ncbi:Fur-regulated basic protein FbpA [Bacillus sp. BP-3]|uniref:Fur-regulated basic protein FbpA n=1 Tax=Bacillus sp. BP-3 TaxID=3022773 RepID=UPI00232F8E78|nr:Fur-regulated basic protein FbpA [Bacillus sp. BP-3]MDC2863769.1 Fur-regulated basic protein FbpA [Bacillus sp. BP-3]
MIEQNLTVEQQKDFYKFKLIEMGYFKTPEGLQLYELSLSELETIYKAQKEK